MGLEDDVSRACAIKKSQTPRASHDADEFIIVTMRNDRQVNAIFLLTQDALQLAGQRWIAVLTVEVALMTSIDKDRLVAEFADDAISVARLAG